MKKWLTHGGDIYSGDRTWLDFSANVNPLGLPVPVQTALATQMDRYACYPDPLNRELRYQLALAECCPIENILCGNGAADLIYRLVFALRPKHALILAPTFSEYEQALQQVDCAVERFNLDESTGFVLDDSILHAIQPGLDILFICNPNNPNGWPVPRNLMLRILERCQLLNVRLVVDECFIGFLPNPEVYSIADKVPEAPNLIVLKALTKLYAMAGIRLGYLLGSDHGLLDRIWHAGPPWNVSAVATVCGLAALTCSDYVERSRELIHRQREILTAGLTGLGQKVYPSGVNYLLFKSPDHCLHQKLQEAGILIRNCANYPNLGDGYYRVAVRQADEQDQLLAAIRQLSPR